MKVKELIKELEMYDKELNIKAMTRSGSVYEIVGFDVGEWISGARTKPFAKVVISNWNVKTRK